MIVPEQAALISRKLRYEARDKAIERETADFRACLRTIERLQTNGDGWPGQICYYRKVCFRRFAC